MGIPDSSLLSLFVKVKSWLLWGVTDLSPFQLPPTPIRMSNYSVNNMCGECGTELYCRGSFCESCGRALCGRCIGGYGSVASDVIGSNDGYRGNGDVSGESIKACKFCYGVGIKCEAGRKNNGEKVHPSESFRDSPEPSSPSYSGDLIHGDRLAHYLESRDCGYSPNAMTRRSSFSARPSPVSVRHFTTRSDEEEAEEAGRFYSPPSEYYHDNSDIDSNSVSARLEFYGSKSVGSSPLDSPSRIDFNSCRVGHTVVRGQEGSPLAQASGSFYQENMVVLGKPDKGAADPDNTDDYSDDMSISHTQFDKSQMPLDFESNGMIWFPPLPEDENDEADSNFFTYDDDDDDGGDSSAIFSSSSSLSSMFPLKDKESEGNKEPLRSVIQAHFRALVSQLLRGDDIKLSKDDGSEDWLDIVARIAWQAANFVKPDTSQGGSMDPGNYVKVKCVASGSPSDSTLVKGIVCTKNIKHKRMTTQYKTPRLLLLGGALENQNVASHLASFNTLVQQENDHLKMIISKIEALRPNVLLVEKSVSTYAQEYLLAKDISLVLNVRKSLLERVARCTGAFISPSIDNISTTRLGHCELFHVERVTEGHETVNQSNRRPSKTLMFFEGCPRRLGCTILLKGACRDQLKKIKHVVQLAVFAAYHLSLETSFLADEGARLPKMSLKQAVNAAEKSTDDNAISVITPTNFQEVADASDRYDSTVGLKPEFRSGLSTDQLDSHDILASKELANAPFAKDHHDYEASTMEEDLFGKTQSEGLHVANFPASQGMMTREDMLTTETPETMKFERIEDDEVSSEYFSANDTHLSILVSFSSRHVLKGTVCERSRLMRIKFYGSFDKPLGTYLRDDLFDQTSCCRYCKEPAEAHVLCYTHQQGNLTINVKSLSSTKLPGEAEGKIWMWHRCLRCAHVDGVPPTTRRVVMSDAAWKLSFGKFLELSFSNHATANRVAPCGHSLQRDCLRFYGFGSMVAFFRYSPVDILNVHLPPLVLEFNGHLQQEWIRKEAAELLGHMETFYAEISDKLDKMEHKCRSFGSKFPDKIEIENHIVELKDQLKNERNKYRNLLQLAILEGPHQDQVVDILELNQLRRSLLIDSHVWDRQLYSLDSLLKTTSVVNATQKDTSFVQGKDLRREILLRDSKLDFGNEMPSADDLPSEHSQSEDLALPSCQHNGEQEVLSDDDASNLSERIDSAWTGTDQLSAKVQVAHTSQDEAVRQVGISDNPPFRRMTAPVRVQSFDSALKVQEMLRKGVAPMSTIRSFHASGDYRSMVRDPISNTLRTYSQALPLEGQKSSSIFSSGPSFISSASYMTGGACLLLPERSGEDIVISVFDNDLASIVAYALTSKDYDDWIIDKVNDSEGIWSSSFSSSTLSPWQSFGSVDMDYMRFGSEDPSLPVSSLSTDTKKSPHLTISYEDDSSKRGKVKFTVTCYFARQFDSLRRKCCPSEVDFVRSLSRCQKWSAQGGKSHVYFAKSMDERFIIKQVTKTELESFEKFAPQYFKYLTGALNSRSPTCLAKILGIYQVSVKHLKGGKETKMDVMVMENLFFRRNISRVYDLKGSTRSRYNPDTGGSNNVLLDMNLVETLCTEPIFLGSKAKRNLERAIWNDTYFLASIDVMDYSLLVGVDVERKELVLGIIDFMRQYTWDKQLETWVKKSGILGGSNASPTIVSPKQYKKRFRKAMTSYFLTVPDQWSS